MPDRQHLRRHHSPPIYCGRCFETFSSDKLFKTHQRAGTCENVEEKQWEGVVTEEQMEQIDKRKSTNETVSQSWYAIYRILFPEGELPKSPCKYDEA